MKGKWCHIDELRQDERAYGVNGDVIRALYDLFWVDLESVPSSF